MLWIFQKISDRLKSLLVADAALDLEAEYLSRHAERKADLLQKAQEYEEQGLDELAAELRQQTQSLTIEKSLRLTSTQPAVSEETAEPNPPRLASSSEASPTDSASNGKTSRNSKTKSTRTTKKR